MLTKENDKKLTVAALENMQNNLPVREFTDSTGVRTVVLDNAMIVEDGWKYESPREVVKITKKGKGYIHRTINITDAIEWMSAYSSIMDKKYPQI